MSLTGDCLFYTAIAVAVGAVIATLAGWNAVRGPRPVRWLARLLMIGLCQTTAFAAVGLWVNDDFALYSSWNDLLGEQSADIPAGPGAGAADFHDLGDRVMEADYRGPLSHLRGRVLVWTPPQYDQPEYRDYRFPVIMLLHGVPGTPRAWIKGGHATTELADMMAKGELAPAILVMPRIDPAGNTDCANIPRGPQTATWLAQDVRNLVTTHFRTLTQPTGWAMAGDSTGGYCAISLPLQYPSGFATGLGFSPDDFHGDPDVVPSRTLRRLNDPIRLAGTGPRVALLVATSRRDPFSTVANAQALAAAAKAPTRVAPALIADDGGHNWGTWRAMYPKAFGWLDSQLSRPRKDSAPTALAGAQPGSVSSPNCQPAVQCAITH
ncbi:alpha/beta hydrolase [Nocardia sp. CDC160]|uniref:alpha/beta hydrolase n=1 Tax=Nocardia sp. CDC160 TaxID=3112166 RepID=UPI002DC05D43|nr:alpha/beta hydrolase-fold protein [Nocardia sp. CDC160]MEC3917964.1 alpha/beta hydrolase-fold protein [Nocardia sp. CDC160]